MGNRPFNSGPATGLEARLKQQAEADRLRRARIAAMAAKRTVAEPNPESIPPRDARDGAAILEALDGVSLYNVEDSRPKVLSSGYRALLTAAVDAINSGQPVVVLCWPPYQPSLSAVANFLALGDLASAPLRQHANTPVPTQNIADAPKGLRAMLFPYARTAHVQPREIQIDRTQMGAMQLRHELRCNYLEPDAAFKDYHMVVGRVREMTGKAKDGATYAEFEHPLLDEVVPHGTMSDGCPENGRLLWHTKSKTDLRKFNARKSEADDPALGHFFVYEVRPDRLVRELKVLADPDLILLDFCKTGRGRFQDRDWTISAKQAVEAIRAKFPKVGILAVTDDPWAYDASRFDVLGTPLLGNKKGTRPCPARVIFTPSSGILESPGAAQEIAWHGAVQVAADGFSGHLDVAIGRLKTMAGKLRDRGNPAAADIARNLIGKLRRSVCLPGSLAELSAFLERDGNDAFAADSMTAYRIASDLKELEDPRTGATQVGADELTAARAEAERLFLASESATPMASLLEDRIPRAIGASSRTIFVFRNEDIADFASHRLVQKFDKLADKIKKDVVRFTSRQGFADLNQLASNQRSQFKYAFVVAPTRMAILETLAEPWLPDEVTFLADTDTLRFAARDAERLATQLESPELKGRLERFVAAAKARVLQIGDHLVSLDTTVPPAEDVEFPFGSIIDLSGGGRGDRRVIELEMQSGQKILARPRTGLVLRDGSKSALRFVEAPADDVSVGDEVCVISPSFVEKARSLLNITAAAADMIRDYHERVLKLFAELEGNSTQARLRTLCERMGEPHVIQGTAHYWIDLDEEMEKPLHEVVPHAPQDRETFMRFTAALGISEAMAARFWAWAVIAQRSSRVRAGAAFHDAYRGILTDQHAAFAANSNRAGEIRALRTTANEYVSQVVSKKTVGTT